MPPSSRLDIACGGGVRQFVAARLGMHAAGFDLRASAVADCTDKAAQLEWLDVDRVRFCQGDMRDVHKLVRRLGGGWPKFGGLFISPPFYKVEKYDLAPDGTQRQPPQRGLLIVLYQYTQLYRRTITIAQLHIRFVKSYVLRTRSLRAVVLQLLLLWNIILRQGVSNIGG